MEAETGDGAGEATGDGSTAVGGLRTDNNLDSASTVGERGEGSGKGGEVSPLADPPLPHRLFVTESNVSLSTGRSAARSLSPFAFLTVAFLCAAARKISTIRHHLTRASAPPRRLATQIVLPGMPPSANLHSWPSLADPAARGPFLRPPLTVWRDPPPSASAREPTGDGSSPHSAVAGWPAREARFLHVARAGLLMVHGGRRGSSTAASAQSALA